MSDPFTRVNDPETSTDDLEKLAQSNDLRVVRAVAINRATSALTLSRLSEHTDTKVRVSVAWHQNTPIEVLQRLAEEANAGFDVDEGPLEPGWTDSIHGRLVWRMELSPEPELLDALSQMPSVPNDSRETSVVETARRLRALHDVGRLQSLNVTERINYLNQKGRAGVASSCLAMLAVDSEVSVRVAVAKSFKTTPEVRRLLAEDASMEVKREVAQHPRTPLDALCALWDAEGPSGDIAELIAYNRASTADLLRRIVTESDDRDVLWRVAAHEALDEDQQRVLLDHPDISIQRQLAANPKTVPDLLELRSRHEDYDVRSSVARNLSAPPTAMLRLAQDEIVHVRLALVGRLDSSYEAPPLPESVCEVLVRDPDLRVRERLFKRRKLPWSKEQRKRLLADLNDLRDSLRPKGHPEFPLSDTARVPRLHGRNTFLSEGAFLTEDELRASLTDHALFLDAGGGEGGWSQMWAGALMLTTYLGEQPSSGKQFSLFLKRVPQSVALVGEDLRFANLSSCFCEGVDLSGALLVGSVATDGFWASVNFTGADLTRVDFSGSDLRGACFVGADLRGADFEKTDCTAADFTDAKLDGSRWPSAILDKITR